MPDPMLPDTGGLAYARVLVAVGELSRAEREVERALDAAPDDLDALGLLAKIKHVRGELSEAIACWTHTQGRARYRPLARMHLMAMLELARDPERGAGEYVAVGQYELARKPRAYLELDAAYRLFLSRRPAEARAECRRVAAKQRGRDRELFKLAVLADALFAELSGALAEAVRALEGLGAERGFEGDVDRVVTLATLYERVGGAPELRAALNICHYLERTQREIPVYGRIAALHRRLGEHDPAARYEELHRLDFDRRMHRVSLAEVLSVAGRRYVPLSWLGRGAFGGPRDAPAAGSFGGALVEAVRGGRPARLVDPGESAHPVEHKYALDIALRDADAARAAPLLERALREDPVDLAVLERALASPPAPWLIDILREPDVLPRAARALEDAVELDPRDYRAWRALGRIAPLRGEAPERAAGMLARASALEVAAEWRERAVGRVLAAAVYRFVGKTKGLVHEIWAARQPAPRGRGGVLRRESILGNVTDEMKSAVMATFLAVREYARASFPHLTADILDYDYSFRITKDDTPSSGSSAGLPTALAFLSVFVQRPVSQDLAFTGAVVADAHDVLVVAGVGDVEAKVKGAYHRDLRGIVVPEENEAELEQSHRVPAAVRELMCRYVRDLDAAVRTAFGDDLYR